MKNIRIYLAILLLSATFSSCYEDTTYESISKHTTLFYLGGDNNLSSIFTSQIEKMRQGWSPKLGNVVIYFDQGKEANLLMFKQSGNRTIVDTLCRYGQDSSSSGRTLRRVINECSAMAPAKEYTLVVTSHASGWLPVGALSNPTRSIIIDNHAPETPEMSLDEFAKAIPDHHFDAIVFETCLTGGVEVAYALRNKANYLLSSPAELLSPGFTDIYTNALKHLCNLSIPVDQRLITFAESYFDYINPQDGNFRSATLSVTDLSRMDDLAQTVRSSLSSGYPEFTQEEIGKLQHFDRPGQYGEAKRSPRYFDLFESLSTLTDKKGSEAINDVLSRVIVWKQATPTFMPSYGGFTITHYSGLTTYLPQPLFPGLNTAYQETEWYQAISK